MTVRPHSKESKQPRILKLPERIDAQTEASFFAISNPGMEKLARREIEEILHGREIVEVVGGLQFQSSIGIVQAGQPKLKTVNRLLLRVDQFGVRDFQKLYRKVKNLPWKSWLKPGVALRVRASSHGSRLKIKKGIERTVADAFSEKLTESVSEKSMKELLALVRIEEDICTLSLDLSGELLHKRGDREDVGVAPLRETWAAGVLQQAWAHIERDDFLKASFSRPWQWIEPMAGTAVFAREALKQNETQAHAARSFAIDECLKIEERAVLESGFKASDIPAVDSYLGSPTGPLSFLEKIIILDRDSKQLKAAKLGLEALLKDLNVQSIERPHLEFHLNDFASAQLERDTKLARFVVLNPPWGVRLKSEQAASSLERQSRLLNELEKCLQPTLVAIVLPAFGAPGGVLGDEKKVLKTPPGWKEHEGFSFRAGGIPVQARFFSVETVRTR